MRLVHEWSRYPSHIYGAHVYELLAFIMNQIERNPVVAGWFVYTTEQMAAIVPSFFDVRFYLIRKFTFLALYPPSQFVLDSQGRR